MTRWASRVRLRPIVMWALVYFSLVLVLIAGWIRYRFGEVTFQAVLANMPVAGRTVGNPEWAREAILLCLVLPLFLTIATAVLVRYLRRHRPSPRPSRLVIPTAAFVMSSLVLLSATGVPNYATAVLGGHTFAPYYVPPQANGESAEPPNLITIYLESAENAFGDEQVFGRNLLEPLDEATTGWASYDGLEQYPGGGWTMAGLISTQCGIPLRSESLFPGAHPNEAGQQVAEYLPGAQCLGDVLAEEGYTNAWMGGADTEFAGKKTYLTDHGYSQIQGLKDWQGEDPAQLSPWGLSDNRLMANAKSTVDQLHAAEEPFNLTLLTLDTHEPAGIYPGCDTADQVKMASAVTCSMRAVADFIDHLESQDYLDDTVVVVMGDHLKGTSGASDFKSEMDQFDERTIVLRVSSPDKIRFNRPQADQFSLFPTTLDLLGLHPEGGRAGLGVSMIGSPNYTGSALELDEAEYVETVGAPSSELYKRLWAGAKDGP